MSQDVAATNACSSAAINFIAGTTGGIASLIASHPFDTIKTRLQAQHGRASAALSAPSEASRLLPSSAARLAVAGTLPVTTPYYHGAIDAFRIIVREEKFIGLYKGITSPMLGVALMNAMIFGAYSMCLQTLQLHQLFDADDVGRSHLGRPSPAPAQDPQPSLTQILLAGCASGLISALITSPIDLVKIQEQMDFSSRRVAAVQVATGTTSRISPAPRLHPWRKTLSVIRAIWNHGRQQGRGLAGGVLGGTRALYTGYGITCLRDLGYGPYFLAYEVCNRVLLHQLHGSGTGTGPASEQLSNVELAFSGALAGCLAWASTFPLDVVKTRIQAQPFISSTMTDQRTIVSVARQAYRQEGLTAFVKGLGPTMVRAIPANAALFVVYEATKAALKP